MSDETEKKEQNETHTIEELPTLKECFIITPIGDVNSTIYIKAMGLIDAVIEPVLKDFGYIAVSANRISSSGSINNQLIKRILQDDLVIANLTGLNPNVMYELAIRHAVRRPVITMAQDDTNLPFDIKDQRTIMYSDSLAGSEIAKVELRKMVELALKDEKPDNPIYQAAEQALIFKELKDDDPLKLIMARLDRMEMNNGTSQKKATQLLRNVNWAAIDDFYYPANIEGRFKTGYDDEVSLRSLLTVLQSLKGVAFPSVANRGKTFRLEFKVLDDATFQLVKERIASKQGIIVTSFQVEFD
jgi:hypothetical protein